MLDCIGTEAIDSDLIFEVYCISASGTEHRGLNDNEETSANKIGREKRGMKSDIEDKLAFCDNTER